MQFDGAFCFRAKCCIESPFVGISQLLPGTPCRGWTCYLPYLPPLRLEQIWWLQSLEGPGTKVYIASYCWWKKSGYPVDMVNIPLFTRFYASQVVVWEFWTINSIFRCFFSNFLSYGFPSTQKKTTTFKFRRPRSESMDFRWAFINGSFIWWSDRDPFPFIFGRSLCREFLKWVLPSQMVTKCPELQ